MAKAATNTCGLTFTLNQLLMVVGSVVILVLLFLIVCHITAGKWRYGQYRSNMLQRWCSTIASDCFRFCYLTSCYELDVQILPRYIEDLMSNFIEDSETIMAQKVTDCGLTFTLNQFLTVIGSAIILIICFYFVCNIVAKACGCWDGPRYTRNHRFRSWASNSHCFFVRCLANCHEIYVQVRYQPPGIESGFWIMEVAEWSQWQAGSKKRMQFIMKRLPSRILKSFRIRWSEKRREWEIYDMHSLRWETEKLECWETKSREKPKITENFPSFLKTWPRFSC